MPNPSRTYQKSSGIYYIRLLVPKALVSYVNKTKFVYSLETKDRHKAFLLALKINLDYEDWISRMSAELKRFPALTVKTDSGDFDFDLTKPEEKEAYRDLISDIGRFRTKPAEPEAPKLLLEDAFESWKTSTFKVYCEGTRNNYYPKVQLFVTHAKKHKIVDFFDVTSDFAEKYRDLINVGSIKALTVDTHIKAIRRFFYSVIETKKLKIDNPFQDLDLIKKSMLVSKTDSYIAFKPHELERLFTYSTYVQQFKKPDLFFGPLIALTMGLRLEEIAQLRVTDIYDLQGLWVIDINDYGDEKEVKTESALRIIPIPLQLKRTNFLEYHAYVHQTFGENALLFPYLINTKNGFGKNLGYNFTQYKTKLIKVTPELKTFHSLRKNLAAAIDDKGYPLNLRKSILGHKVDADITNDNYPGDSKNADSKIVFGAEYMFSKLNDLEYEIDFNQFQFEFKSKDAMERLMDSKAKKLAKSAFKAGKSIKDLDLAAIGSIE